MSDERKVLLEALGVMYNRFCDKNPGDIQLVTEAYDKIRQLIQQELEEEIEKLKDFNKDLIHEIVNLKKQKPEIDDVEKYIEEKARGMYQTSILFPNNTPTTILYKCRKFITQIISDVRERENAALIHAIGIIRSYQLDIESSKERPYLNINLVEKGFCQGIVYERALSDIEALRRGKK